MTQEITQWGWLMFALVVWSMPILQSIEDDYQYAVSRLRANHEVDDG